MQLTHAASKPVLARRSRRRTQVLKPVLIVFAAVVVCVRAASAQKPVASHGTAAARPAAVRVVARVNGAPITSDRLDAALNRLIPFESFHRSVSADTVERLRGRALDGLVDEELRYQDGVQLGVNPTRAELDAGMKAVVARYASREAFDEARRATGVSIEDLRREIRRAIVVRKAFERAVTSRCQVHEDEAARYYAANTGRFVVPEQLHVYAITFGVDPGAPPRAWEAAKAKAEQVLGQIRNGAPFEEMARAHSTDKAGQSGGDMGFVHRGSLADEFEAALRDAKPGGVSPVIQTLYGYHIVRVASIRPPAQKALREVAAAIQKDLTKQRCADTETAWTARLRASATIVLTDGASGGGPRGGAIPGGRQ
jgi:parvulin-like peptidyl-prolyl isomerase